MKEENQDSPRWHFLKTWPGFFQDIADGKKTFEIRKNDRPGGFQVGDLLCLYEWEPQTNSKTGRQIHREVTHILAGQDAEDFGVAPGYCIMSIRPVEEALKNWISVNERLPEKNQEVFLFAPGGNGSFPRGIYQGYRHVEYGGEVDEWYLYGAWQDSGDGWASKNVITHWMLLPERPK